MVSKVDRTQKIPIKVRTWPVLPPERVESLATRSADPILVNPDWVLNTSKDGFRQRQSAVKKQG